MLPYFTPSDRTEVNLRLVCTVNKQKPRVSAVFSTTFLLPFNLLASVSSHLRLLPSSVTLYDFEKEGDKNRISRQGLCTLNTSNT